MSWGEVVAVGFVSLAAMVYASLRFAERAQRLAHKRKKLRARLEKLTLAIARLEEHDERNS